LGWAQGEEKLLNENVCPECGSINLIHDDESGEIVCSNCGLVIKESVINKGPEWRAFTPEEKESRSRVGGPLSLAFHDRGLSTTIGRVGRDAFGHKIPLNTKIQMLRLRKWQIKSRSHSSVDHNLYQAMIEINRLTDKLHIPPPVKERAAIIYRKAFYKGLVRGRSISIIVAASLYAACRATQTPKTLRELAKHSLLEKKDISRGYRLLLRELSLQMPIPSARLRVSKIASKMGVDEKTQQRAMEILREAERLKMVAGKNPIGLAAAALYIACVMNHEKCTQKRIADAAGVTEVTVRNRYKGLKEDLTIEI
jgi:transcription initiation factor TFIIB